MEKKIKRKVTCAWGEFTNESKDFILEPYTKGDEEHSEVLYIEKSVRRDKNGMVKKTRRS